MFIVIGSVCALNQDIKYMRYLESCQRSFMFKDLVGDNHVSSESGNIKSGALVPSVFLLLLVLFYLVFFLIVLL